MRMERLVPKSVLTLKALLAAGLCLGLLACGKKKDPPAPCATGVNGASCSLQIKDHSTWSLEMTSYNQDPQTKKPIPGSERRIQVSYEFRPATPEAQWRRTMIVESANGNTAMFEEGTVKEVSGNKISLHPTLTSCEGSGATYFVTTDFDLYYSRLSGTLKLDTQPIVTKTAHSLSEVIVGPFVDIFAQSIQAALESAFTFGSARRFLTSGKGTFNLDSKSTLQNLGVKKPELGCFNSFGSGFSKSSVQPVW